MFRGVRRPALLAGLLASVALGLAPTARAATVEVGVTTGTEADAYIQFSAARGERNRVKVVRRVVKMEGRSEGRVTITDTGVRRLQGRGASSVSCRNRSAQTVICLGAFAVFLGLGDRNDRVSFDFPGRGDDRIPTDPADLAEPPDFTGNGLIGQTTLVNGGKGDDVIFGTPFDDVIGPGPGRDRVMAGGGPDEVVVGPDGARDVLKGGAGVNALRFFGDTPVKVDTRKGRAGAAGEGDKISGFRRVTGGSGDDALFGGDAGEALYGGGGGDRVDGRGGADLVVGSGARLLGGAGNDLIDARSFKPPLPTSTVTCGEGFDRVAGETDDFLEPSCEAAVYRVLAVVDPSFEPEPEDVGDLFAPVMPIAPLARGADRAPTFDVPCPAEVGGVAIARCAGTVVLERPPTAGSTAVPEQLGSGPFDLQGGQRAPVAVALNDAGRQALATPGRILAVHVTAQLTPRAPSPGVLPVLRADFGWQETF